MNYCQKYLSLIEELLKREIEKNDGIDDKRIMQVEKTLGIKLPCSLVQYYQTAGDIEELNHYYNLIYLPEEFKIIDGKLVFMEENQLVCYWGINLDDLNQEDPEVYQGQVLQDSDDIDWYSEEMTFSVFITEMLNWEYKSLTEN